MRGRLSFFVVGTLALGILASPVETWGAPKTDAEKALLREAESESREAHTQAEAGKFDEAIKHAERAVALREKLEPQSKTVIGALRNLANIHHQAGQYARAVATYERALAIHEKIGTKGAELRYAINDLARTLVLAKMYERAIAAYQREISIAVELDGNKDTEHAAAPLTAIATPYIALRRYQEAEVALLRAVKVRETQNAQSGLHHTLLELGKLYREQGLYARAEPVLRRAVEVCAKGIGIQHAQEHMRVLAMTLAALENYDDAKVLIDKLLEWAKEDGEERVGYAVMLGLRGDLDMQMGAYDHAEIVFKQAQSIVDKLVAKNARGAVDVATVLGGARGRLLLQEGDFFSAEKLLLEELDYLEKKFGPKDRLIAEVSGELAELYRLTGKLDKADAFASRAVTIRDESLAPTHPYRAESRAVLGRIREARGDAKGAQKLHEEALAMREKAFGVDHPHVGSSLLDLADLARRQGQTEVAENHYKKAVAIFEKNFGPDHGKVATAVEGLSALYATAGKLEVALRLAQRAADIRERQTALFVAGGSDAQKRSFLQALRVGTDFITSLHARLLPTDENAKKFALTTIFQRKGRVLDLMAGSSRATRKRLAATDTKLFDELAEARADVARLALRGPAGAPLDEFRAELAKHEEKARALEEKLGGQSEVFRAEQIPVSIERVQGALPEGMVLVEFSSYLPRKAAEREKSSESGPTRFAAYVLDGGGKVGFVDLGEAEPIERAVHALRQVLSSADAGDPKKAARALDELVMQKVRPLLGGKTRVLISADGLLSLVPFAALVDENGKYLVESLEMTYLTSGRDLIRLSRQNKPAASNAVVIANPAFGNRERSDSALDLLQGGSSGNGGKGGSGEKRGLEKAFFTPLPATGVEARKLATLMPEASILVDVDATEVALKQVHAPRMLHIATHGFFVSLKANAARTNSKNERGLELDTQSPDWLPDDPLLRSGIALAGANAKKGGGAEDGILTALEASSLDLQGTKLVVLSACETGLGDVLQGEGIYGLRRALFVAGAESLVVSLWQVADEETQALMVAFYERVLRGETRGGGLRNVQLSMLAKPPTAHPYFWASFGVFGNAAAMPQEAPLANAGVRIVENPKPTAASSTNEITKVAPSLRGCACELPTIADSREKSTWIWGTLGAALFWLRRRQAKRRQSRIGDV
ncbi:MAG TPA: CHAT domain-containing protein [Polyangium sp.]|nr:CHAT domain-containing protein [Polyangium sp.]